MTENDCTIDRFHETWEGGVPAWFVGACLANYNFKSFRRFVIYLSHYGSIIDLRETPSKEVRIEDVIAGFQTFLPKRIPKKALYQLTGLTSKTTFNQQFKSYFEANDLVGRRSFDFLEVYKILAFWQGEGQWGRLQAAKKEMLASILHNKNYERTAAEFKKAIGSEAYKPNLVSPKKIKQLIEHIDITEDEAIEKLMGYKDFQNQLLWIVVIVAVINFLDKNRDILDLTKI